MNISDLMTKKPILIKPEATVLEAIKKMQYVGCGILPVGEAKNIVGIITDHDILLRSLATKKEFGQLLISEIMTKNPVFCYDHMTLQQAADQMKQYNIRRVLVVNKSHELSGILSLGDILRRVNDKSLLPALFFNRR